MKQELLLNIDIRSRKKQYFSGKMFSVTSTNEKGEFDILPEHANFICLIRNYVTLNKGKKDEQKFIITNGVLRIEKNKVDIFLDV